MAEPRDDQRVRQREGLHAAWEGFIVLLVCLNLALILFDSLFALGPLNRLIADWMPGFYRFYDERIHEHFLLIDLGFVAVFLFDVLLGWAIALFEHRYRRWYYYPFAHWYDVLGCIPLSGFRWLRVLRVGSLLVRLQRLGLIDVRHWGLYTFVDRYYQLLLEELSNRVLVKMFTRLQQEIGASDNLARRLVHEVIRPRKERLLEHLSSRLQAMLESGYHDNRGAIEGYVGGLIHQALAENGEMRNLRRLPLGGRVADSLDDALSDIAVQLLHAAMSGLRGPQFQALARNLADECFEAWLYQGDDTDQAFEEMLVDIIEVLKQQIADRRWSGFVGPDKPAKQL